MAVSSDVEKIPLFTEKKKNRVKECSVCLPVSLTSEKNSKYFSDWYCDSDLDWKLLL